MVLVSVHFNHIPVPSIPKGRLALCGHGICFIAGSCNTARWDHRHGIGVARADHIRATNCAQVGGCGAVTCAPLRWEWRAHSWFPSLPKGGSRWYPLHKAEPFVLSLMLLLSLDPRSEATEVTSTSRELLRRCQVRSLGADRIVCPHA